VELSIILPVVLSLTAYPRNLRATLKAGRITAEQAIVMP
jgi:hypothetical protein